jgi:hypothetical protein
MTRPGIPVGRGMELRLNPVVFGEGAPGVRLELWSRAGGNPVATNAFVVVPARLAEALADALRDAASRACVGPLFAPVAESKP